MIAENLKEFYCDLEADQRVSPTDEKVKDVQWGVERIVHDILKHVEKDDGRFTLNLVKTGSFYDEAKVGEPDEFDYVAEIQGLSRNEEVQFEKIPDPVFLQVKLKSLALKQTWKAFLSSPEELKQTKSHSMSHVSDSSATPQSSIDLGDKNLILDPVKVQKRFRGLVNRAFGKIDLPPGWEHGGCNRPKFSGIRRHGPATMLQLVYRSTTDEYKVNVDLTIGIALPLPVRPEAIGINVFPRIPSDSKTRQDIKSCLKQGPCLHVIPLYSNLLVSKRRFENKFSWRVSCSGIEKFVFDQYPSTSGVKICMRMIKAIRELFLAEDRRKTHRQKRKKRRAGQNREGQISPGISGPGVTGKSRIADKGIVEEDTPDSLSENQSTLHQERMTWSKEQQLRDKETESTGEDPISRNEDLDSDDKSCATLRGEDAKPRDTEQQTREKDSKSVDDDSQTVDDDAISRDKDTKPSDEDLKSHDEDFLSYKENLKAQNPLLNSHDEDSISHDDPKSPDVDSKSSNDDTKSLDKGSNPHDQDAIAYEGLTSRDENIKSRDDDQKSSDEDTESRDENPKPCDIDSGDVTAGAASHAHNYHETDTTDLTEMEHDSNSSSKELEYRMRKYQLKDISEMNPEPGTGEYYGPRTYMPSIEVKSFIFNMITLHPEDSYWTMDTVCQFVMDFYSFYYHLLRSRKYIKHFFFNTIVSSPIKEDQRAEALAKFEQMLQVKHKVVKGELNYQDVKQLYKEKAAKPNDFSKILGKDKMNSQIFRLDEENNVCLKINDFVSATFM